jgi:hypothetical protein
MEASMLSPFNKRLAGASLVWLEYCDADHYPACRGGEGGMCGKQFFSSMTGLGGQLPRSATSPATKPATTSAEGQPLRSESAISAAVSKRRGISAAATLGQQIGPAALDQAGCSSFFLHVRRFSRPDAVESDKVLSAPSGLVPGARGEPRVKISRCHSLSHIIFSPKVRGVKHYKLNKCTKETSLHRVSLDTCCHNVGTPLPGAGENSRIWKQGDAQGLDRVPRANVIIFRVQSVILGTPVYIDDFAGVPSVILYPTLF